MTTHDPIPARLAALKTATTPELKAQWRDLSDSEPLPFNRRYLESRLAYRIQELAYGGLKPETIRRLERLGEELDGGDRKKKSRPPRYDAHRRHPPDPRVARRGACGHRHWRRLRMAGQGVQVALGDHPRHHRREWKWGQVFWICMKKAECSMKTISNRRRMFSSISCPNQVSVRRQMITLVDKEISK